LANTVQNDTVWEVGQWLAMGTAAGALTVATGGATLEAAAAASATMSLRMWSIRAGMMVEQFAAAEAANFGVAGGTWFVTSQAGRVAGEAAEGAARGAARNSVASAARSATRISSSVKVFGMCQEFASRLQTALQRKGISGALIRIDVRKNGQLISDTVGPVAAPGGSHFAIRVGDTVFDNLRAGGISFQEFLADLGVPDAVRLGAARVTETTF